MIAPGGCTFKRHASDKGKQGDMDFIVLEVSDQEEVLDGTPPWRASLSTSTFAWST